MEHKTFLIHDNPYKSAINPNPYAIFPNSFVSNSSLDVNLGKYSF